MASVCPKVGQEGGKMGTQRGQEGAREAQVGPKSGQKKRDSGFYDFWTNFAGLFWRPFLDLGGLLKPSGEDLFKESFLDLFWGRPGR